MNLSHLGSDSESAESWPLDHQEIPMISLVSDEKK